MSKTATGTQRAQRFGKGEWDEDRVCELAREFGGGKAGAEFGGKVGFVGSAAAVELGVRRQKSPSVAGMQYWRPSENSKWQRF